MGKGKYILFDWCLFSFLKTFFTKKTVKGKFEEKNKLKCVLKKNFNKKYVNLQRNCDNVDTHYILYYSLCYYNRYARKF